MRRLCTLADLKELQFDVCAVNVSILEQTWKMSQSSSIGKPQPAYAPRDIKEPLFVLSQRGRTTIDLVLLADQETICFVEIHVACVVET